MQKKFNYLFPLLFLVALALFLPSIKSALALETNYPTVTILGNSYNLTDTSTIITYAQYAFYFLIASAGFIGVISIVISGLQILIYAGNPESISTAKERIFGAILGIVLLFFSYIILSNINPQLTILKTSDFGPIRDGLTITFNYKIQLQDFVNQAPINDPDTKAISIIAPTAMNYTDLMAASPVRVGIVPQGIYNINTSLTSITFRYVCTPNNVKRSRKILIRFYDSPDGETDVTIPNNNFPFTKEIACDPTNDETIFFTYPDGAKSFTWSFEDPGVYFYSGPNCLGLSSLGQDTSGDVEDLESFRDPGNIATLYVP